MIVTPSHTQETYRQADVQAILQLAIAQKSDQGELTRDQLFEIAAELDIPPTTLQAAEQAWFDQQVEAEQRQAFDTHRWQQIRQKLGKYLITNTFLVTLDFLQNHLLNWSLFILLIWGLFLSLEIWKAYHLNGEDYERAFESWKRKYELRRSVKMLWQTFKEKLANH